MRFLAGRCNTPIWWRSAKCSSWRTARERKTEDKVAKSVGRERSIGEEKLSKKYTSRRLRHFERHPYHCRNIHR